MSQNFVKANVEGDITTYIWNNKGCFVESSAKAETLLREVIGRNDLNLNNEFCIKENLGESTQKITDDMKVVGENMNSRFDKIDNVVQKLVEDINEMENSLVGMSKKTACRMDALDQKLEKIIKFIESMKL